jgi:hypothetical protein
MKTLEEQFQDATESLKQRGVTFTSDKATLEEKLCEAQILLEKTPVRKRNGLSENMPMALVKKKDPMYARLVEGFQSMGLSEKEARFAAMDDQEFAEANFQERHGYLFTEN